jgi:uncharacterized spore protein YtfJ
VCEVENITMSGISSVPESTTVPANGVDTPPSTSDMLRRALEQLHINAKADLAFGTPRVVGQRTLIPVARVSCGFGGGSGPFRWASATQAPGTTAGLSVGGTVGASTVRPVAIVEVTSGGVRILPVVDIQAMLARVFGLATAALIISACFGRRRARGRSLHLHVRRIEPHLAFGGVTFQKPPSRGR